MPNLITQADETDTKKFYRIDIRNGEFASKGLKAELSVCSSPVCECTDVYITLMDDLGRSLDSFSVDVREKSRSKGDKSSDARNGGLAGQIIRNFDDEDWQTLWRWFFTTKNYYTENIDPTTLVVDFPMADDIENHSELVPFRDILPHGKTHYIEYPDETITLDEQYCLVRGCDCDQIAITFIATQNGIQRTRKHPLGWVRYRKGKMVDIEPGDSTTRKPKELLTAFMRKYPELMETYAKRHQQLVTLYKFYRERHRAQEQRIPKDAKVMRNELCPCGSGKKYKRCCG